MYFRATRSNITFAVNLLSRFMHYASELHFQATKKIVRYIKGAINCSIKFSHLHNFMLHDYFDNNWAGFVDDIKSTTSYCFSFGSRMFSWCLRKQDVIAQSTAEIEYIAAITAVNQAIWIKKILVDLHMDQLEPTRIYVDNQTAISFANNHVFHCKIRHFKIKLYFFREVQKEGDVIQLSCQTNDQIVDVLTKALSKANFEELKSKLGVCRCH
jgi:hypothetical protein